MKILTGIILLLVFVISCSEDNGMNEYNRYVKKEMKSNKKVDSIFFGIYFGMTSKDFYTYCWEMNRKGMFTDGTNNMYVLYKMNKELKHPASMNFYPDFIEDKIYKMRTTFQYNGWAPWNKQLCADSLLPDLLDFYKRWYNGNPFIRIYDEEKGTIYVKVDGNRRITIGKFNEMLIKVDYTDLSAEKEISK